MHVCKNANIYNIWSMYIYIYAITLSGRNYANKKQATCNYKVMIRQSIKHQTIRTSLGVAAPSPKIDPGSENPKYWTRPLPWRKIKFMKQYPPNMDILLNSEMGPFKKETIIFQAAIFRGNVNFQGCITSVEQNVSFKATLHLWNTSMFVKGSCFFYQPALTCPTMSWALPVEFQSQFFCICFLGEKQKSTTNPAK